MSTRQCTKCKRQLSSDDFYTDKTRKDGLKKICKECIRGNMRTGSQKASAPLPEKGAPQPPKAIQAAKHYHPYAPVAAESLTGDFEVETDYPEFDWDEKLEPDQHYSIVDIAPRNSGKSTYVKWTYPFFRSRFDVIIFFCQSQRAQIYKEFLTLEDKRFAFKTFNHDLMDDLKHL